MSNLLDIKNLTVKFPTRFGEFTALDNVSMDVVPGEIHGLVGESGAGKSTVGAAVIGLLQGTGYVAGGEILFKGKDLTALDDDDYHRIRGNQISMIFQDPQTSLNPLLTVSEQLVETIRQHSDTSYEDARTRAVSLLQETGIHDVEQRIDQYPHQFSGGMRQRVVIALALCTDPDLIIADEPTTALDVSVQKQILALIRELCTQRNIGIILITHDIGVISEVTNRVTVLRSGRVIESGLTSDVLMRPQDEYTKALMAAVPRLDKKLDRFRNIVADDELSAEDNNWHIKGASAEHAAQWLLQSTETASSDHQSSNLEHVPPMLSVNKLSVVYYSNSPSFFRRDDGFTALSDISFDVQPGEVLGVVGESGSGKSTLAKAIVGLVEPSAGSLLFQGEPLPAGRSRSRNHPARRQIQMVFQDPYSSLNNRKTVEDIIAEPVRFYGLAEKANDVKKLVASVLELVEMPQRAMLRYPHQFSGGQRQRIAVARALVARPDFLICDEPTSALDVSIQAQMLNLLKDLQETFGLSIMFISHNLAVVRQMADRVIVLQHGKMVESADTETFFNAPVDSYSQQLLRDTPSFSSHPTTT
jgi:peptide/nickel transport system ATP-binding protein